MASSSKSKQNAILSSEDEAEEEEEEEEEEEGDRQDADSSSKDQQQQRNVRKDGMVRTWSQRRASMGLFDPPTPRSLNHKRQKNVLITSIIAEMKVSPRKFKGGTDAVEPKGWKARPNAQQSSLLRSIKKRMQQRKLKLKAFQSQNIFDKLFSIPEGMDDHRHITEETFMASKVEVVARDLIGKTAYYQNREQQGVWAQLGKPYECLGVPCVTVSKECPMPELGNYDIDAADDEEKASFQFFKELGVAEAHKRAQLQDEELVPLFKRKKEMVLQYARASANMTRMLIKMGLMHFHDLDSVRFPRAAIEISDAFKKIVKKGSTFPADYDVTMMASHARKLTRPPLEAGEQYILGISGSPLPILQGSVQDTDTVLQGQSVSGESHLSAIKEEDIPDKVSVRSTKPSTESQRISRDPTPAQKMAKTPPLHDDSLVFEWKKRILTLRRDLEHELHLKLVARSDRREHWRSSSPFSSEVAEKVMEQLNHSGGRQTPNTWQIWKEAQDRHVAQMPTPVPDYESETERVKRFYDRVCTFVNHQRMADPLMDILVYFLKDLLEDGQKLEKLLLHKLCLSLAKIPDELANVGRMASVMPILQFICKEVHFTSTEFKDLLSSSGLDHHNIF